MPIGFPFIGVDNKATGRLVAEHLLDRGFQSFAIYDLDVETYFNQRREAFVEVISEKGYPICVLQASGHRDRPADWERNQDQLVEWLHSLTKPVGIMACNDQLGFWLLDACRRADISVPEDVAVVGAEDDETLCEVSIPTMSSVQFNRVLPASLHERFSGDGYRGWFHLFGGRPWLDDSVATFPVRWHV
ncbi:MAG: substrate-binding domain-containing protein, partial [Planctomycetaceae bacterium]